jgi:hypothetical protein
MSPLSIEILMQINFFRQAPAHSTQKSFLVDEIALLNLFAMFTSCDWLCFAAKRRVEAYSLQSTAYSKDLLAVGCWLPAVGCRLLQATFSSIE